MAEISSFTFVSTYNCADELILALKSLALHHPSATVFIGCDVKTSDILNIPENRKSINLNLRIVPTLTENFSGLSKSELMPRFKEFLTLRPKFMKIAIAETGNTLMMGCDMVFLSPLKIPTVEGGDGAAPDLCLSPANIAYGSG